MSNQIDSYLDKHPKWEKELRQIRATLQQSDLKEDYKWSRPVYSYDGKNIVGFSATKTGISIWFFQGALLEDPQEKLINAQKDKTQAMRQWRLEKVTDSDQKNLLLFIDEAIENHRQGREIKPVRNKPLIIPKELKVALEENDLTEVFKKMNLTSRRDFAEYISTAVRSDTKIRRIQKIIPMIKAGTALNDKYKK